MTNEAEYKKRIEALENAFDASYDGIHILDSDGKTILINKACERIEGITKEDIGDKTIQQLVEEGYYSESVTLMVLKEKREVTKIQRVKNGKEILVTGMPIYDDNRVITKVIVNSRDITELSNLREEIREKENLISMYREELEQYNLSKRFTTNSKRMKAVVKTVMSVAKVNSNILITGESGTGKSLIAEIIHNNSQRKDKPFVKIDCSAIPENLFESELFGYEGGAFTGASANGKTGLVQMADKGTVFLDEIGEIPIAMQSKLLRFIQEKRFYKVGGEKPIEIDVRIISATNRDLTEMARQKTFREDLLYRLNVIPLELPPLRERKEDIPALILKCLEKINDEYGMERKLSARVMDKLIEYDWPGNIRELENIVERIAVTAAGDSISDDDIPMSIMRRISRRESLEAAREDIDSNEESRENCGNGTYKEMMNSYEYGIFNNLISKGYTPIEISEMLSMDVTTVRRKLHKHGIDFKHG